MKKIKILGIIVVLMFNFTAYAGNFYLKSTLGLNHISKNKFQNNIITSEIKLKSPFPVIGLGIGYNFDTLIRVETVFDYYFLVTQLEKSRVSNNKFDIVLEAKISDLMLNIIKEKKLSETTNIFIGGGIGISFIKDNARGYGDCQDIEYQLLQKVHGKNIYRFAYKVTTGIDYQLQKGIRGEIAYNFYNLGKNNPWESDNISNPSKRKFLIHNITMGLRFLL